MVHLWVGGVVKASVRSPKRGKETQKAGSKVERAGHHPASRMEAWRVAWDGCWAWLLAWVLLLHGAHLSSSARMGHPSLDWGFVLSAAIPARWAGSVVACASWLMTKPETDPLNSYSLPHKQLAEMLCPLVNWNEYLLTKLWLSFFPPRPQIFGSKQPLLRARVKHFLIYSLITVPFHLTSTYSFFLGCLPLL